MFTGPSAVVFGRIRLLRLRPVRLAVLLHDLQDGEVRDVVKWLFRLKGQQRLLRLLIGADAGAV